jgi:AraC family transcriptional regulator of adaptative response/methylated-DNA-[protein]-cysteine methyltransferase
LVLKGTDFRIKVWEALLRVPEGALTTYGRLAAAVGRPRAVRAVASCVAANDIAALIPCHRVIRSSGALGEYRWGAVRKRALLALELARQPVSRQAA